MQKKCALTKKILSTKNAILLNHPKNRGSFEGQGIYYSPGKLTLQWKQKQSFEDVYVSYGQIVIFHLVI